MVLNFKAPEIPGNFACSYKLTYGEKGNNFDSEIICSIKVIGDEPEVPDVPYDDDDLVYKKKVEAI